MQVESLAALGDRDTLVTDLLIIGGGPTGLTIAQQFEGSGIRVLILESGLEMETPDHAALNAVESIGELGAVEQAAKRKVFHAVNSKTWSHDVQQFGVRCRALGGSTHAWAGKSAPFDPIDFRQRAWIEHSGWPIDRAALDPFIERAIDVLNLSPRDPDPKFESAGLRSFFWQFARSRTDRLDIMRFGADVLARKPAGLRILLDATVTRIALDAAGTCFSHVEVASVSGKTARVDAKFCVLAASGIENPRLLLASSDVHANGIGNAHDVVGRYLMDHPGSCVGQVPPEAIGLLAKKFGFYGVQHGGRAHMFMHGLSSTPEMQEREGLLNAAVYFLPLRSPDDPWDALKRLLRRRSNSVGHDVLSVASGLGLLATGIGTKILAHERTPKLFKDIVINTAIRFNPNFVAGEFQNHGLPHKLRGLSIEAITEQMPNRDSRVMLASRTDRFGVPMARIDWRINDIERRTLQRIAELTRISLIEAGLPAPILEPWVRDGRLENAVIIDMGHTLGTTRMAVDPRQGVVDANCKVHGVDGLYVAGGSVFPTSGHANPTLMILAVAIRLADHLKSVFARS